jgi:hypothetical protein
MIITQEMARTMLMDSKLTDIFWTHAVHTTIHIQNRVMLRNNNEKTPYELWKGRPTNVKHFRVFGSKCYIKREDGRMGKFDSRVDKGVLVGYSSTRKAYKCYNLRLNKVVESINVTIDETGGQELKEEENESMEQLYEEEAEDEEEVYIEQPEGFQLSENADYVCKLKKALYGLKQAPRAWYSRLDKYLQQAGFRKGSADNNLYIKVTQDSILLIEFYVDDIIFGSNDDRLSQKFAKDMQNEFEMSLLGELSFFLGLQIRQKQPRNFYFSN